MGAPGHAKGAGRSRRPSFGHILMPPCGMDRCYNCGQELIEIDSRGERVTGCLTCNLWSAADDKGWRRLSEEDLRALHQLRHGGSR